ncbi:MAG TPA: Holliday junction branch migration protein RuvA [Clostridia bacterium]|nr:Holliday junction branch migration protein RuvA [Clostridia bacterium]
MIAHLRGKLVTKHPNQAIVECGGVGYDVVITVPTFSDMPEAGAEVALHIHTHVREDQLALFGFLHPEEKRLFERLISVSGIGPKLAITILSGMPVSDMVGAIRASEVAKLTKIPGIGKKTAERMVLELKDKLEEFGAVKAAMPATAGLSPMDEDVLSALMNLGYQRASAEQALTFARRANENGTFDQLFRQAMAVLAK